MVTALWVIRAGTALCMLAFGVHQIRKPKDWAVFIPAWFQRLSPISNEAMMRLHSLGNLAFGLFLVVGIFPLVSAWVALIWWIFILPFVFPVDWAAGMRDLAITCGLIALVLLTK
jgi:uncharacterized membrane protein YphA (DoxX/SURF4 family)